jgi:hypothetical protein
MTVGFKHLELVTLKKYSSYVDSIFPLDFTPIQHHPCTTPATLVSLASISQLLTGMQDGLGQGILKGEVSLNH